MKNCSESSDDEYLDAEGTYLTDYESTSPTESDYLSDSDDSDCEPKFRRMRSLVCPRGDLTHSPDSQCYTSNPITVFQTEEVAEDADLTYFDLINRDPILGCPLRTVFSKCHRAESLKVSFHL